MTQHQPSLARSGQSVTPEATAPIHNPWLGIEKSAHFFENEEVASLIQRSLFYARAGVPIHFQGTAGRGKTALAMEVANRLGRPVCLMTGNDWLDLGDMVGKQVGHSTSSVVDKYVQRVRRSEATIRHDWEHAILAEAMIKGHTLVYDEFTRANAQANGILLSVLEEGVLVATDPQAQDSYIQAHPHFRIILTSNPHDYAGVNTSPDALLDRMISFRMTRYSLETECGIISARTGIPPLLSERIVRLISEHTQTEDDFSMRAAIMIAQIAAMRLRTAQLSDALLAQIATDVLNGRGLSVSTGQIAKSLKQTASKENKT